MDLGLSGRAVLVTGASRGIGLATARAYAAEGARVAITYANDAEAAGRAAELLAANGAEMKALPLDLEDLGSIASCVAGTLLMSFVDLNEPVVRG